MKFPLLKFTSGSNHISVDVMDAYWFQKPMSAEEQQFMAEHLEACAACRGRVARLQEVFPTRQEPTGPSLGRCS